MNSNNIVCSGTRRVRTILATVFLLCAATPAFAESPLAVVHSERNQATYSNQHIGEFDDDWKHFKHTFETANVRYDQLNDADITKGGGEKLKAYKVIVVPLLVDMPQGSVKILTDYVKQGGKLIATDSCGIPSQSAREIMALAGAKLIGHSISQDAWKLVWPRAPFTLEQKFSVGTLSAKLLPLSTHDSLAHWTAPNSAEQGTAISCHDGNYFIGWAPGTQGEIASNAQIISLVLEEASPGITQQAAVQISFADYQKIKQELQYLDKRADEVIKTAKQADLVVPFTAIQKNYDSALVHEIQFEKAYQERQFLEADREIQQARNEMSLAFAKAMPVRLVQQRGVWLDRGTIIANQSPELMRQLLDKLKESGINTIYFETNNAGYAMFPSMVAPQNPQLKAGFDIFGLTLEEAHKRGMEFHAWLWVFNVGNQRHNLIIGKAIDFPGPVLSEHGFTWALAGKNGSLLAHNQHEYWLDPALAGPRQYVKGLLKNNYNIPSAHGSDVRKAK